MAPGCGGEGIDTNSTPAATAANVDVDHFTLSLDLPRSLGEVAIGHGTIHVVGHLFENDNGFAFHFHFHVHFHFHFHFHQNHSQITGVGTETGDEYVGQFVINQNVVSCTESGGTETFQLHLHGVSKGSSPTWFVTILAHVTLNANGELPAETAFVEAECRR